MRTFRCGRPARKFLTRQDDYGRYVRERELPPSAVVASTLDGVTVYV